jgi:glycosyltransferase involved in cell wall biosynthesis
MNILHTEASPGWGGQEIRIIREVMGMKKRGHNVICAVCRGGGIVPHLKKEGITVYELPFTKLSMPLDVFTLIKIMREHNIDIINTHSSRDAWVGGIAARLSMRKVVRTRHLSTAIRPGLNSIALYNTLADAVVTTCEEIVPIICKQARISRDTCISIPTGIDPTEIFVSNEQAILFREKYNIPSDSILVGTVCILRMWKGVEDLLKAAKILQHRKDIIWVVVGSGVSEKYFRKRWKELELEENVIFTGYLPKPYEALAAMDIFSLLSTANEGVSQASLQAAYMQKPLVTTWTGGLPEVCIHNETGFNVANNAAEEVAEAVTKLAADPQMRASFGMRARQVVEEKFTMQQTLEGMEKIYTAITRK